MTKTNYPSGGCETWDMSKLDIPTLQHEIKLCHQVLYGAEFPQWKTSLKGILNTDYSSCGISEEGFNDAKNTWLKRLKKAEDELFERQVLL